MTKYQKIAAEAVKESLEERGGVLVIAAWGDEGARINALANALKI